MDIYMINCPSCGEAHYWFSGNFDQRCVKCVVKQVEDARKIVEGTPTIFIDADFLDPAGEKHE